MSGGKNCYPESDFLINKYNIRDKELLEKFEIQKVFAKLLGLDVKPTRIAYTYDVEHMVSIHKYLFFQRRKYQNLHHFFVALLKGKRCRFSSGIAAE